jgi:soluble lytic murein transglycosylase-like protein
MSILSALKTQSNSIDDLAKLPQAMIMQMAQKKQISEDMLAPILSRKAELAEAFARQNALRNAGQTPPTVMEQLMAQNAQAEQPQMPPQVAPQMQQPMPQQMAPMPQDMGVAQLPIPERQYAGGGIIAFADGGLSDEDQDYEDALEEADYDAMIESAMNAGEEDYAPVFETKQAKGSPQSFPNSERSVGIASARKESKDDIRSRLLSTIMQKESGGRRYDKNGNLLTSPKGAEGEMQVMPYTSRDPGFGVKPARDNSPDELKRVGDDYAMAMYNRYGDPKLAMIAYNMGPGATDKWIAAGADPRKLPKETQGYIRGVNLAQGGEVQHFTKGGEPEAPSEFERDFEGISNYFGEKSRRLKQRLSDMYQAPPAVEYFTRPRPSTRDADAQPGGLYGGTPAKPISAPPARSNYPSEQEFRDFDQAAALFQAENMGKNAPTQAAQETPKSRLDQYMERMLAREKSIEKQRGDDKNMALLTAGLGMLSGTSPYAFENIGKGALAGVQNFSESRKQRGAEQAALDKSMLYATRYQGAEDIAKQNAAYNRAMKQQQYELDVKKHGTEQQKIAINQYETHIKNAMASLDKNTVLSADPAARAAAEEKILNGYTARNLYKRAYGEEPQGTSFAGFSAVPSKK